MGRNSKDDSLSRYEELLKISVRYNDYLRYPRLKMRLASGAKLSELPAATTYVRNVKKALERLEPNHRILIEKEFFSRNNKPTWWSKYYSKSTYYRVRSLAIKSFIDNFES